MSIQVFHRKEQKLIEERVYGGSWISLFYGNGLLWRLISCRALQKLVSKIYGYCQRLPSSAKKVEPFVREFGIEMHRFLQPREGFRSFDEFFVRELKPEHLRFPSSESEMGSPCEARLSVFPIEHEKSVLVVKGHALSLMSLVGGLSNLLRYNGGFAWVFRLCPTDYHRFHFFDSGRVLLQKRLAGSLHSVNPLSLEKIPGAFLENERNLAVLNTDHFGEVSYLEVGALCVGTIEQFKGQGAGFLRGEQKGAFHFGGSTVIVLTQPGVVPDQDLIETTNKGLETLVCVGEKIGLAT